jgi:hypothetical protein
MQPFQRHIKIKFDRKRYLYQKDERALPGNLQNRKYSFLPPPPPNVVSITTSPLSFSLSLSFLELLFQNKKNKLKSMERGSRIKKEGLETLTKVKWG